MKRENASTRDTVSAETSRKWVDRAKALKPLLEAAAPRIEQSRNLPPDVMDALHEAQMFRTVLPRSVGGAELDPATHAQVVAAIAEGDASAAWCIAQSACASMAAAYVAPEVLQEIWSDPRAVFTFGFTSGNPPCLAVPVKGGWKVNGTWTFGSGSHVATWLGGHCRMCDESGTPLKRPDGRFVERTMLMPRSAVTLRDDTWEVMGLCGTGSDTYSVTDLFVPTEFSVVPRVSARDHQLPEGVRGEPEPERREMGTLYRHSMQLVASAGLSSVAVGIAQATLDAFILLARKKSPFNANQSLRDDGWVQARVAQADASLCSAKSWLVQLLDQAWDECVTAGEVSFPLRIKLRQACTHQIDAAREVVTMLFLEAGATAIFRSNPFERRFRDVHTVSIQVQGSVARMQTAGQYYLGLAPQQMILIP
ncbi:MAG: acyl-CoA dehydrogenase family protein [Burkholderiales bacterium]|nr:acyl-CoA dehydrogenase family protein [Burkholderiales bacterium]